MKILSIDVGMKNLAFCLLSLGEQANNNDTSNNLLESNYNIEMWDIVNLCDEQIKKCGCNKKMENAPQMLFMKKMENIIVKHMQKNTQFKIPPNYLKPKNIEKKKMTDLQKIIQEMEIDDGGKKLKKVECLEKIEKCQKEKYYDFFIKKTTNEYSMVEFGIILKDRLKKKFDNVVIDVILIENQIGPLALRMKTLQGMLMQHFIENGKDNIKEISASNKLKKYLGNKKTTYAERKKKV